VTAAGGRLAAAVLVQRRRERREAQERDRSESRSGNHAEGKREREHHAVDSNLIQTDVNNSVNLSWNDLAVLLSTCPLTSTIVIAPRCSSAILIIGLLVRHTRPRQSALRQYGRVNVVRL
jgi:hypothetical protein